MADDGQLSNLFIYNVLCEGREGADSCNENIVVTKKAAVQAFWFSAGFQTGGYSPMQGKTKERWMELCEQAAVEQDPEKLMELIEEINRMLDEKDERLHRVQSAAEQ